MKVSSICTYSAVMATTATAFTAPATNQVRTSLAASSAQELSELIQMNTLEAAEPSDDRPVYDPLSMYPADAPERRDDRIRPLEAAIPSAGAADIADPLRLYGNNIGDSDGAGAGAAEMSTSTMSRALPFLTRPLHLDGALAGDAGFDPLGLAATSPDRLVFMREAEIKHARLAMLAAAGWVGSELAGGRLSALAASPLLRYGDRVPSLLNGGLGHSLEPFFPAFAAVVALAGVVEAFQGYGRRADPEAYAARSIGDLGFDPLGMYGARGDTVQGRRAMEDAELKHGRLAMLAITAFAMQEAFTGVGVVTQVLSWLHPHSAEFLAEGGFASNVQAILSGE